MRLRPLSALAVLLVCTACQTIARIENPAPFDANEAAFIKKEGKVTVSGHAFVTNSNGGVTNAAGQQVYLIPVTAYSSQRIAAIFGGRKSIRAREIRRMESDPDYINYTRIEKADSGGKFSFEKVGPGSYYLVSQMTWKKEEQLFPDGAEMYETAKVTGAEKDDVEVVLSGNASGT